MLFLVVTGMAFDAKAFANWNVKARYFLREMLRRKEFHKAAPNLAPVWAVARSELSNLIKKTVQGMLSRLSETETDRLVRSGREGADAKTVELLALVKRLQSFPESLQYQVNSDGTVLIYSSDRYLEKALYFGTRELPRLRPIDYLVFRMSLRLQDRSLVFTARDFRKAYEIDAEFKRENLRQVTPYHP